MAENEPTFIKIEVATDIEELVGKTMTTRDDSGEILLRVTFVAGELPVVVRAAPDAPDA